MKIKDIVEKSDKELKEELKKLREKLRDLNFDLTSKELASHRDIRKTKKDIASIITIMREREIIKEESKEAKNVQNTKR